MISKDTECDMPDQSSNLSDQSLTERIQDILARNLDRQVFKSNSVDTTDDVMMAMVVIINVIVSSFFRELEFVEVKFNAEKGEAGLSALPNTGIKLLKNSANFIQDNDQNFQNDLKKMGKRRYGFYNCVSWTLCNGQLCIDLRYLRLRKKRQDFTSLTSEVFKDLFYSDDDMTEKSKIAAAAVPLDFIKAFK
uniref:DDE_Tnp_1_7 domain-containing protein n=1 Tax=Syphacia muris TaxID=451379 RepID=A0A0N5AUB4_9BILA